MSRRWIAAALAALLVGVGAAVALSTADGPEDPAPTQEAGSRFAASDADGQVATARRSERSSARRPGRSATNLSREQIGEAVAGLFLVGFSGTDPTAPFFERLQRRHWGAILLDRSNAGGRDAVRALTRQARDIAALRDDPPPVVVARQEGGDLSAFPDLPPAPQAAVGPEGPDAVRATARRAARALRDLGIDAVLAPSADLDIVGAAAEGRGFAEDPVAVTRAVRAAIAGWEAGRVAPIVGRFPGLGAASQQPEAGPATVGLSLEELRGRDLRPFAAAARAAPAIQMSEALYVAFDAVTPATLLPQAVGLLRRDLSFDGTVVSGDLVAATAATGGSVGDAAVGALRAGCDLLFVPGGVESQEAAFDAVVEAVRTGKVSTARVTEALKRVRSLRRRAA